MPAMKASILPDQNTPLVIEEVTLDAPKAGEVLVRIAASGVCHSDLSVIDGTLPLPTPIVLGHEGAGVVETVGPGVTSVKAGDHVVLSWRPQCSRCAYCLRGQPYLCDVAIQTGLAGAMLDGTRRLRRGADELFHMTQTACMAEYAVVPESGAIAIDPDIPLDKAALVGCAVTTGVGAVFNTAKVEPGASVAVFGVGGVGLSVVQGCRIVGADPIVAVDLLDAKLEAAGRLGATHTVNAQSGDAPARIRDLTGGQGADYAFEAIGNPDVVNQAYDSVRRGGKVVVIGVANMMAQITVPHLTLVLQEKAVLGSCYGSARPQVDMPRLLRLYKAGRLKLDEMVTRTYRLEEVNQAFEDLRKGVNLRGVLVFS
ncbi:MAG: Zn-dependent alcohol dehydrogenase [Candidatus Rokubacteria bacterium]|nr:Zn-dependent alcohol dehydrogenase [Candidatus Rokubacteria bacterium]